MPEEPVFELQNPGSSSQEPVEQLYSCPAGMIDAEAVEALDMWAWMKRGFLPEAGGAEDQCERDLQMIEIIDSVASERNE